MANSINYRQCGRDLMYKTWHSIDDNMFILFYSDGGSIVFSENTFPIKRGALCFVAKGKFHYTMPDNPNLYERSKLFIGDKHLNSLSDLMFDNTCTFSESSAVYAILPEEDLIAADKILSELNNSYAGEDYRYMLLSACAKLMWLIFKNKTDFVNSSHGAVSRAVEYINKNISEELSVDKIAKEIHLSCYHFCRIFKKATGETVAEYIKNTRLVLARDTLSSKDYSISDISENYGFSSPSYFCREFKKKYGVSPLKYRKILLEKQ